MSESKATAEHAAHYIAALSDMDLNNLHAFVAMHDEAKLQKLLAAAAKSGNRNAVEFTEVALTLRKLADKKGAKL